VQALTGIHVRVGPPLDVIKHAVTRYRITLTCYTADFLGGQLREIDGCRWVLPTELKEYPLSTTARRLSRRVE
jgi:A/G-specific adenine glycosylase